MTILTDGDLVVDEAVRGLGDLAALALDSMTDWAALACISFCFSGLLDRIGNMSSGTGRATWYECQIQVTKVDEVLTLKVSLNFFSSAICRSLAAFFSSPMNRFAMSIRPACYTSGHAPLLR